MDYTTKKVQKAFDGSAVSYDEFSWIQSIVFEESM